MKANKSDWYKSGWTLDIKRQSWTENTKSEVDFLEKTLGLTGTETVLDLACGYGRHSLELARRGYRVIGVDITPEYVEDANQNAIQEHLKAEFFCDDLRNLQYKNEFDVVLNMADGAIGYLENDVENLKIFDIISEALKPHGKSFIDIQSGDYAVAHFPQQLWEAGAQGLTLSAFDWDPDTHISLYGQLDFAYGESLTKPEMLYGNPTRLYTQYEVEQILRERGMKVYAAYTDINGTPASEKGFQLKICSEKLTKDKNTKERIVMKGKK